MAAFSRTREQTLHRALSLAGAKKHEFATLEHLLFALTEDQDAIAVMRACNVDVDKLRERVGAFIDEDLRVLVVSVAQDAKPTLSFQRAVQRPLFHVQSSGSEVFTGPNVLVAYFSERESHAVPLLTAQYHNRQNKK